MWPFHKHEWKMIKKQAGQETGWGYMKGFEQGITMVTHQCQANPLHFKQTKLLGDPL